MANYKILWENSNLGAQGSTVSAEDIIAAPADIELLLEAGIIEPTTKTTPKEKD